MNRYTVIAREGYSLLLVALVAAFITWHFVSLYASLVFWLIVMLLAFIYRDPERDIPSIPLAIVSPADAKVIAIDTVHDPYLQRQSTLVKLMMSPFGVFTTRSPVEGKVHEPPHLSENDNSPHGVWLQTDEDDNVVMVMNKGRLRAGPRSYVRYGERIGQGKRCGFIPFGSEIDLYLPETLQLAVVIGEKVQGGSGIIARLVHT